MALQEHLLVKPEVLAKTSLGLMQRELVIPMLFARHGIDNFVGALDDAVNYKVRGVLPAHDYEWRNDRTNPIQVDQYAERKVQLRFGGNAYSAIQVTDEQMKMDLQGWGDFLSAQCEAVANHLEIAAVKKLEETNYGITLKLTPEEISKDIVEARRCLNVLKVPSTARTLLVGTDVEAILQTDPTFNQAQFVGDANANTALKEANIGRWKGFNIVVSQNINPADAYAFDTNAFVFLNAAPGIPTGAAYGSHTSYDSIAMRWLVDYDFMYQNDRSAVNTWYGFNPITDPIAGWDSTANSMKVTADNYMVRAIKLSLNASADTYFPAGSGTDNTLAGKLTGLTKRSKATAPAKTGK